jgi:hypothetical protein
MSAKQFIKNQNSRIKSDLVEYIKENIPESFWSKDVRILNTEINLEYTTRSIFKPVFSLETEQYIFKIYFLYRNLDYWKVYSKPDKGYGHVIFDSNSTYHNRDVDIISPLYEMVEGFVAGNNEMIIIADNICEIFGEYNIGKSLSIDKNGVSFT